MLEKHLLSPVRNMFVTLCGKSLFAGRSLTLPLTQTIYAALMASSAVSGCAPKVYLDELVCDQELALCPLMITQPLTHKFARRHACGMDDPPFCRRSLPLRMQIFLRRNLPPSSLAFLASS